MTCLKFVDDSTAESWNNARQACKAMDADLALVKYLAEAQRIEQIRAGLGMSHTIRGILNHFANPVFGSHEVTKIWPYKVSMLRNLQI